MKEKPKIPHINARAETVDKLFERRSPKGAASFQRQASRKKGGH
jgi:hypothetical protein